MLFATLVYECESLVVSDRHCLYNIKYGSDRVMDIFPSPPHSLSLSLDIDLATYDILYSLTVPRGICVVNPREV